MFCNHFPQKLKGLLVKVGLPLSFGCMRLNYRSLGAKTLALLTSFVKRFLKLNQRFYSTL
ncbi:sodium:proton antiporter [Helicobacter pylori]|uniref:sodium:proton antiporter n=1 Tax=Helicobacter pylori TaxID=210 RepID=UPI0034E9853E